MTQLSLLAPQDPPAVRQRSRGRHTTRRSPRCAVEGRERPWGFRKTFTEQDGFELGRSDWVTVELCGTHGRQLTTMQMHKLAR